MFEQMTAAQLHNFGRTELPVSQAEDIEDSQVALSASQPFRSLSFVELRNMIPTNPDIISPFVDQLMRFIARFRAIDETSLDIELALREALVNAMVHGNHNDPDKYVCIRCRCIADGEVAITVEDEGDGFKRQAVPDPTSPENRLRAHGRGIYLMSTLMDEVDWEQGGSVVHMCKKANADSDTTRKPQ